MFVDLAAAATTLRRFNRSGGQGDQLRPSFFRFDAKFCQKAGLNRSILDAAV
jgi:hypothetical protein